MNYFEYFPFQSNYDPQTPRASITSLNDRIKAETLVVNNLEFMISNGIQMSKGLSKWNKGKIVQYNSRNTDNKTHTLLTSNAILYLFLAKFKMAVIAILCATLLGGVTLGLIFGLKKDEGL